MKLLFLLLIPIYSLATTNSIEFDDSRSEEIYKLLDIEEVIVKAPKSSKLCNRDLSYDSQCSYDSYTKEFYKEVGSLKCALMSTTGRVLMATGEVKPMTSNKYNCSKKYSSLDDDLQIFEALKSKKTFKPYDRYLIEMKELKGVVMEKKTYFKHGNISFTYYKKTNGNVYHEEAKDLFEKLDVIEIVYESNIKKESKYLSCTKHIKSWNTEEVYNTPTYECSLTHLQNYFYSL